MNNENNFLRAFTSLVTLSLSFYFVSHGSFVLFFMFLLIGLSSFFNFLSNL